MMNKIKTGTKVNASYNGKSWEYTFDDGDEETFYGEMNSLFDSEFTKTVRSLLSQYGDGEIDDDLFKDVFLKRFTMCFEKGVDEFMEFMEHDPNKHCELLYLSSQELFSYGISPHSRNYYHLYIDGEKVNNNIYSFDTTVFSTVRNNKTLNENRFVILRRHDLDLTKYQQTTNEPCLKDSGRVVIDTKTGRELLVPLNIYAYQTFSKNSNFVILKKQYSETYYFMFLPACIIVLGDKDIRAYWETETHFYVKSGYKGTDDYDEIYKIDKETAHYEKV